MNTGKQFDKWSFVHLFGSMFLCFMIHRYILNSLLYSMILSIFLGFVWEMFDYLYHKKYYAKGETPKILHILDITGFSKTDILCNNAGVALYYYTITYII